MKPHAPTPAMVRDTRRSLDDALNNPFDGSLNLFAFQMELPDHVKQIVSKSSHFQPGFVRPEPMVAHLVPVQRVLAFLDPVFNIPSPVVHLDHFTRCKP